MVVVSRLPNRAYHVQLADVDGDKLVGNLQKLLIYALLELLSLVLLNWMLRRRVRLSPIAQLAFVLETRWLTVQWELIPWIAFFVQTSLYHFGGCALCFFFFMSFYCSWIWLLLGCRGTA